DLPGPLPKCVQQPGRRPGPEYAALRPRESPCAVSTGRGGGQRGGCGVGLRVTLIQGGGVGLDQVPAVRRVLEAGGVRLEGGEHRAGLPALEMGKPALPPEMLRSVRETGLALKTKLLSPPGKPTASGKLARVRNVNVQFRRELGLFASVRPLKNLPGLPARFQG